MVPNKKLIKIFEYALNQEETGMSFFKVSLQRMGVGAAVTAFKRLIEEEAKHIKFINRILKDLREKSEIEPDSIKEMALEPTTNLTSGLNPSFLNSVLMVQ